MNEKQKQAHRVKMVRSRTSDIDADFDVPSDTVIVDADEISGGVWVQLWMYLSPEDSEP